MGTSNTGKSYAFTDKSVTSGKTYGYKIQSVSATGDVKDLNTLAVTVDVPTQYALYQNFPNPFNPSTTIRFDLKEVSTVTMEIYNTLGQKVISRNFGLMSAGSYNKNVNFSGLASGVYLYRITAAGSDGQRFTALKKLMLMK